MTLYADRYREIRQLGKGITGTVYLVRDEKTGLDYALKELNAPLDYIKPSEIEGFRHEFEILKNFSHPSIARVFDAGILSAGPQQESKHFYLVTEFVQGEDLFTFTEGKPLEVIEDLFVQALRALNYLHSKNVIHLDLKPQNILVMEGTFAKNHNSPLSPLILRGEDQTPPLNLRGGGGELKLIDFGYANFYQRKFIRSDEGELLTAGTTPYVAPEVIDINLKSPPDQRADLYSLGCAFYRVLTREVPFPGNSVNEIHNKHRFEKPRLPSKAKATEGPPLPDYWDKILLKLMEKNRADRYPSAQAVIEDLNLLSGKSYAVELPETRTSYLPQSGKMVARVDEFKKFTVYYADRIHVKNRKLKPYLIIRGKNGTGKTRFLEECKNHAQANFVRTLSWKEYKSYDMAEDIPQPCLVLADEVSFNADDIEGVDTFLSDLSILVLFATSRPFSLPPDTSPPPSGGEGQGEGDTPIIELKDFTKEQTAEYLTSATGLSFHAPHPTLDTIFKHTHGNPLYLTEYVRALFEKGFFKDAQGSWSLETLEDLGSELESIGPSEFIKKRLREKLESANLQEQHLNLLYTLALTGKPTLEDLVEISMGQDIEEYLKYLVEQDILDLDPAHHYSFSNALFGEVVLEQISPDIKAEICDQAARYWESQNAPQEKVLYYRGRGGGAEAPLCLLELAKIKREQLAYLSAKENLVELIQRKNLDPDLRNQALLELGEIFIETGKPEEAETWLNQIPESNNPAGAAYDPLIHAKMLELLGLSYTRRNMILKSDEYFRKGLDVLRGINKCRWMEVILKNRLARNRMDSGNQAEAEKIFNETWQIWEKELPIDEKIRAIRSDIDFVYTLKGDYERAIACLKKILEVVSQKPSLEAYPVTLYKLAYAYIEHGEAEHGEKILLECIEILKNRKTPSWLYRVYNELGISLGKRKKWDQALHYSRHAFELAHKLPQPLFPILGTSYNIGQAYFGLEKLDEAQKYFEFVRRNIVKQEFEDKTMALILEFDVMLGLAAIFREKGKKEEGLRYLQQAGSLLSRYDFLSHLKPYFEEEKALF